MAEYIIGVISLVLNPLLKIVGWQFAELKSGLTLTQMESVLNEQKKLFNDCQKKQEDLREDFKITLSKYYMFPKSSSNEDLLKKSGIIPTDVVLFDNE